METGGINLLAHVLALRTIVFRCSRTANCKKKSGEKKASTASRNLETVASKSNYDLCHVWLPLPLFSLPSLGLGGKSRDMILMYEYFGESRSVIFPMREYSGWKRIFIISNGAHQLDNYIYELNRLILSFVLVSGEI
jgi:hypothetical protein